MLRQHCLKPRLKLRIILFQMREGRYLFKRKMLGNLTMQYVGLPLYLDVQTGQFKTSFVVGP